MSNLTNSKRISYKATYNQVSPKTTLASSGSGTTTGRTGKPFGGLTTTGKAGAPLSSARPFEKTVFIQGLKIVPSEAAELTNLRRPPATSGITQAKLTTALNAISALVSDQSTTSTLNNAAAFAEVDAATLRYLVGQLSVLRQNLADVVTRNIADIAAAYRKSLTVPSTAFGGAATKGSRPVLPRGTTQTASTSDRGIPIVTTVTAVTSSSPANSTLQSNNLRVHVAVDDGGALPAAYSPILAPAAATDANPSTEEAITWAEKNATDLFGNLVDRLLPHMPVSQEALNVLGPASQVIDFLKTGFTAKTDPRAIQGMEKAFNDRMQVEPVGWLHLERIEMYPAGVERGELLYSLPLTPGETVNVSHKEWAISERDFTDIVQDSFAGYSEQGVAEKTDVGMASDSQSQHATALNVGASLSASYASVTLSTSFGFNSTSNESQSRKDSRNHSISITKQASARTRKDHKTSFTVTSVAGSEDQSVRVISNPSTTDAMRVDYFQLARKWKVDLLRYGLRMTYDIVIPDPGSAIITLVQQAVSLDAMTQVPFSFTLPVTAIYYNSLASDPHNISNYDVLAAQYGASVPAAPDVRKWVTAENHTPEVTDYDHVHFDSLAFSIDENYYIYDCVVEANYQDETSDAQKSYVTMIDGSSIADGAKALIGMSGDLSLDIMYQYVYNYAINIIFICRPKVQYLIDWRLQVWNQLRQAAQDQYNANLQTYKDQLAAVEQQIASFDALTLRGMEQEEIMKGVLRWLLGPTFYLSPPDIASLFGSDSSDPQQTDVLDPNKLSQQEWMNILNHGEFIKFIHNAIEWENVLYFTYPYFWDDAKLWDFKKFLYHPDPTHRKFLRSGAARVVLTIRPGFEDAFAQVIGGNFSNAPQGSPYVTIAQEIQDFAKTNYPGFPPANPEENARPLLYLEQQRVWREMQFIIQLLSVAKTVNGTYPDADPGNTVPVAALQPFLDGQITINGTNYKGINDYNGQTNAQQLTVDPTTAPEDLLPTYAAVPVNDTAWKNPYFYKFPGDTGDYDLICYGSDGKPGGDDKAADISANCEASLISTWFEYTPTAAMDIGITMTPPNTVPQEPDSSIA
ncbi:type II secretion system protein GspG [Burkholderia pyrrocinia]|uniref:type II secretion system protein GspG n=1 Tax=Burkholderia pyrrocinia TaxID=60550 RepID=UPI0015760566|nr:type II secretion system protein GspG [Burkholderia pyrrocinia]